MHYHVLNASIGYKWLYLVKHRRLQKHKFEFENNINIIWFVPLLLVITSTQFAKRFNMSNSLQEWMKDLKFAKT